MYRSSRSQMSSATQSEAAQGSEQCQLVRYGSSRLEAERLWSVPHEAKLNSKVPLVWMGLMTWMFGVAMLMNPAWFLQLWLTRDDIGISNLSQADSMMIASVLQNWGIGNLMLTGSCSIACRVGSEQTRMHINLALALGCFINTVLIASGFDSFTSLGCSNAGLVFSLCLLAFTTILSGLGAGLSFELAPLKKPIYWGIGVMAVMMLAYSFMFLFFTEMLINGYHVPFENATVRALASAIWQYGMSGWFFQMSVYLLAGMMTTDFMYIYALNRYIAMIQLGFALVNATSMAWWKTKNEHGDLDGFIVGQAVGCFMSFVFFFMTYVPLILLDSQIARRLEKAIGGTVAHAPPSQPTLLSTGSQQKTPLLVGVGH